MYHFRGRIQALETVNEIPGGGGCILIKIRRGWYQEVIIAKHFFKVKSVVYSFERLLVFYPYQASESIVCKQFTKEAFYRPITRL